MPDHDLPTDWVPVLTLDSNGGYDWTILKAFWSPSQRRYFWHGSSGCSCNYWGDDLHSAADFRDGDKAALREALRDFAETYPYSIDPVDAIDAVNTLARFTEAAHEGTN